jgi:Uma2 family endonuclease
MSTKKETTPKGVKYEFKEEEPINAEEPAIRYATLHLDETKRYTYADYLTWFDDIRRELIDGFIHLMSAPVRIHQGVSVKISFRLALFIEKRKGNCHIYYAPFDVRLPKNGDIADDKIYDVVQPDICVICDLSKLDDKGCVGAPDFIVEILSPSNSKHDCKTKYDLYEKFGVREYWIVDPHKKTVMVYLLESDGKYNTGTKYECHQKVPVHIFEGLEIDLQEVFVY